MSHPESLENSTSDKTELSPREWKYLNRFSEPGSRLWKQQLRKIDKLRVKYPPGSPAQQALNIFDPRTGLAERIEILANLALEANKSGNITRYEELMNQLKNIQK